jgi:hypothetical protein
MPPRPPAQWGEGLSILLVAGAVVQRSLRLGGTPGWRDKNAGETLLYEKENTYGSHFSREIIPTYASSKNEKTVQTKIFNLNRSLYRFSLLLDPLQEVLPFHSVDKKELLY